jgi:hypothetical protein
MADAPAAIPTDPPLPGAMWTMFAFSEGDPDALHRALEATLEKLRHRYELRAPE